MASQSANAKTQLTIVEKIFLYSLILLTLFCLGCALLHWNFSVAAKQDLGQEALKQKDAFDYSVSKILESVNSEQFSKHNFTAQQKTFLEHKISGLVVLKSTSRVILSSYNIDGFTQGRALNPNDSQTISRMEQMDKRGVACELDNGDLIWFFPKTISIQGQDYECFVGISLRFRAIQSRVQNLVLSLVLFLFLGTVCYSFFISRLIRKEIQIPGEALSKVLRNTVAKTNLEEIGSSLTNLKSTWQPHHRHEYAEIFLCIEQFLEQLNQISGQAKAMADDRLQEVSRAERLAFGGLAQEHLRLAKFLDSVAAALDQLAIGNFEVTFSEQLKSEGSIGNSFHKMQSSVQFLIERLSRASDELRTSATQLHDSSSTQAKAAIKQAAGVMTTMATMEELAASSGHIADTAKHVVKIAEETLNNARDGQAAVENVGEGMEEIVKASLKGAERLLNLDEKSRSIGRVATLIAGVAEQSKILALNAAIEAAHAGEAGRGFSVVAEEVRNLADSVFESTREIEDLINEIQVEIRHAVQASEEEVRRANKGRELAHNAQETIVHIFSSAENMNQAAHQIELATNQQRSASGQVATAVREMASSADDVAKGAKNVLASLDDLGNLADDLQQILVHFDGHGQNPMPQLGHAPVTSPSESESTKS